MSAELSQRTLIYLLLAAFLGGLSAYIISVVRNAEPAPAATVRPACADEQTKESMRNIMLDALDHSLHERVQHLFDIWIKDDTGQPARARNGINIAVTNYLHGRGAVKEWDIPTC